MDTITDMIQADEKAQKDIFEERIQDTIYNSNIEELVTMQCPSCNKGYIRNDSYETNLMECKGPQVSMTIADRAARMALDMHKASEIAIYTTCLKHPASLSIDTDPSVSAALSQTKGWAKRPKHGRTLGNNTVQPFCADITDLFEAGQREKGKKMSATIISDILRKKYPQRYEIPSEHFITSLNSSWVQKHKKQIQALSSGEVAEGRKNRRSAMPSAYSDKLDELLAQDEGLMPKLGRAALLPAMGLNVDTLPDKFPAEASIRKIGGLRSKMKNMREQGTA